MEYCIILGKPQFGEGSGIMFVVQANSPFTDDGRRSVLGNNYGIDRMLSEVNDFSLTQAIQKRMSR